MRANEPCFTLAINGLPPGTFELDIIKTVLERLTIRGSIVGTRQDLQEAIDFAAEGKVTASVTAGKLEDINEIFRSMREGKIDGRIVIRMG